ncbi:hypothetical protein ACFLZ9_01980 [Patescibacteria group bacterium]
MQRKKYIFFLALLLSLGGAVPGFSADQMDTSVDSEQAQSQQTIIDQSGGSHIPRQFLPAMGPPVIYQGGSGFIPPGSPYTFIDGALFNMVSGYYTREMLERIVKDRKFEDIDMADYYELSLDEKNQPARILFIFGNNNIPASFRFVDQGMANILSESDGKTTSFATIAKAGLEAIERGANTIVFVSQGSERILKTKSRSIGFSGAGAGVVPGEEAAANMVSGLGWGKGESGYRYPVWVHAFYGRLYSEDDFNDLWNETTP